MRLICIVKNIVSELLPTQYNYQDTQNKKKVYILCYLYNILCSIHQGEILRFVTLYMYLKHRLCLKLTEKKSNHTWL